MNNKEDYCRDKFIPDGSNLYYATLYETQKNKHLIYTMFSLHYELFNCLTASHDLTVTELKFHWWQEELDRLWDSCPRHPITHSLLPIVNEKPFIRDHIRQHYHLLHSLLHIQNEFSLQEWQDYWYQTLGQFWGCAEQLTGGSNNTHIVRNGGIIFTLDILQNFQSLSHKLSNFLPQTLLKKNNANQEALNESQASEIFGELLIGMITDLNNVYYELKKQHIKFGIYHAVMNRISAATCNKILQNGDCIMQYKTTITPLKKLYIAWCSKFFLRVSA